MLVVREVNTLVSTVESQLYCIWSSFGRNTRLPVLFKAYVKPKPVSLHIAFTIERNDSRSSISRMLVAPGGTSARKSSIFDILTRRAHGKGTRWY